MVYGIIRKPFFYPGKKYTKKRPRLGGALKISFNRF
jgi:hypothetical protein